MITGYNTDVRYRERVFHVQTEDKGLANPFIESVVYIGGQVLVAKRASYSDLVEEGKGQAEISARMDQQHRMMIAAIRAGRLDEKMVEAGVVEEVRAPAGTAEAPEATPEVSLLDTGRDDEGPSLDQVILDYLTTEAEQDRLLLELEGGEELAAGGSSEVRLSATSSRSELPVSGARVTVKMISTVRDPVVLAEGETDEDGSLRLELDVPEISAGAAAVIVSATSIIGSTELKYLL